jgi:DUF971 family protein
MPAPLAVDVSADARALELVWEDGSKASLPAAFLRANCRSAPAQRLRLEGREEPPHPDLTITSVVPVGHYAINLAFSDGHARGIYPWAYLRELAARASPEQDGR